MAIRGASAISISQFITGIKTSIKTSRAMFTSNDIGIALDLSDFSTLYQDAAGTVLVTAAGQPVGLCLEKSKGLVLGSELNSTGSSGWSAGAEWSISGDAANLNAVGTYTNLDKVMTASAVVGRFYEIKVKVLSLSGQLRCIFSGNGTPFLINSAGDYKFYIYAAASYGLLRFQAGGGVTAALSLSSISVKEIAGNHAYQANSACRPLLGRHPITGARNLITYSENTSTWSRTNAGTGIVPTITQGILDPLGGTTALSVSLDKGTGTTVTDQATVGLPVTTTAGKAYTSTVWLKTSDGSTKTVLLDFNGVSPDSGTSGLKTITGTWQKFEIKLASASDTSRGICLRLRGAYGTSNSASLHVWHPQQEEGLSATNYQKTNSLLDITEAGIPYAYYLKFDGIDDFLVTNSINFTNTDKVTVIAAVRKLSTIDGVICELSASVSANNGSFYLASPAGQSNPNQVIFVNKGTAFTSANNPNLPPPMSLVVTCKGSISSDTTYMKTNNTVASSASDLGTGNYGNYPLYIGRRGGTTIPFNGHLYDLMIVSRLATDTEITAIERALAKRMGVTLS